MGLKGNARAPAWWGEGNTRCRWLQMEDEGYKDETGVVCMATAQK